MIRARLSPLRSGEQELSGDLVHYLVRVHRLGLGSSFIAFSDTEMTEATVTIVNASTDTGGSVRVRVGEVRPASVTATRPIVVVQALAKGDKCDQIVRDATELGATTIVFAQTERCTVQLEGERRTKRQERYRKIAEEASRQCGRADVPTVMGPMPWLEALDCMQGTRVCFWERATTHAVATLEGALLGSGAISFAVGPEGGLSEAEVREAEARGAEVVSLGRFILRTETVATAVLGAIRILEGRSAR